MVYKTQKLDILLCFNLCNSLQVFVYNNVQEKTSANEECCGLNKISKGLGCCNYQGFNPYTHVCADHSSMEDGRFDIFNQLFQQYAYRCYIFLSIFICRKKKEKKCNLRPFSDNFVNLTCDWEVQCKKIPIKLRKTTSKCKQNTKVCTIKKLNLFHEDQI